MVAKSFSRASSYLEKINPVTIFIFGLVGYSFLSWIILLRDTNALNSIVSFYPSLNWVFNLQSWGLSHHLNTIPTALLAFFILASFLGYVYLLKAPSTNSSKKLSRLLLVSLTIILFSYPVLSTDIFDYTLINRVFTKYDQNLWTTPPSNFPDDPFFKLGVWQKIPSVYGPVYHLISIPITHVTSDSLIGNIIGLRLLNISSYLVCIYLLLKISKKLKLKSPVKIATAFALNPAVLIEFIGSAHNDIVMISFMLLALFFLAQKRPTLSGLSLGLGFLVKLFSAALSPFILSFFLTQKNFSKTLKFIAVVTTTTVTGLIIMGPTAIASYLSTSTFKFSLTLNSLPNLVTSISDYFFVLPFIVLSLILVFFTKTLTVQSILSKYSLLSLIYLLFVISLFWPWYFIWVLPFALLQKSKQLVNSALALSFTSQLYYPLLMTSHRFNYQLFIWTVLIYLTITALPTYFLFLFFKQERKLLNS